MSQGSMPDFKPKSKMPAVLMTLVGVAIGAGGASAAILKLGIGRPKQVHHVERPAPPPSASAKPVEKPAPKGSATAPSEVPPAKDPLAAKAAAGDAAAAKTIEGTPLEERTAEQIVALAAAATQSKRTKISEITHKIELLPKFATDTATRKDLADLAADAEVARDLVLALAALPGDLGPDVLYRIGPGSWQKTPAKQLASDVLYAKDVRPKASKGLGVYLDLANEKDCDKVAKILERVKTDGDTRSLKLLDGLRKKTGCGPKERDDCYACLREGDLLKDAAKAAAQRKVK